MIASTSSPVLVGLIYATFLGTKFISETVSGNQTPTLNKFYNREFKLHVCGKQQKSESSWEFLKIENEIKTAQNNSFG